MEHKTIVTFDPANNRLSVVTELLPGSELEFHQVAALLDDQDKPSVSVEYTNVRNVLSVSTEFQHTKNVAVAGLHALQGKPVEPESASAEE